MTKSRGIRASSLLTPWEKVEWHGWDITAAGCWEFRGAAGTDQGYRTLSIGGRSQLVHRVSFEQNVRPLQPGEIVMHSCDNPPCINPAHLSAAAGRGENNADRAAKGRSAYVRGESASWHKLTWEKADDIRRRAAAGEGQKELAAEFGVSQVRISQIIRGKAWVR